MQKNYTSYILSCILIIITFNFASYRKQKEWSKNSNHVIKIQLPILSVQRITFVILALCVHDLCMYVCVAL